jgi:hypothetical protein
MVYCPDGFEAHLFDELAIGGGVSPIFERSEHVRGHDPKLHVAFSRMFDGSMLVGITPCCMDEWILHFSTPSDRRHRSVTPESQMLFPKEELSMSVTRLIALLLAAMLATAFLNGSALADESQDTGTETSAPADEGTPPVDAPPPTDTEEGDSEEGKK